MEPSWPLVLPESEHAHVTLGPFDLWVHRRRGEASLAWRNDGDEARDRRIDEEARPEGLAPTLRLPAPGAISLVPRTAPISVVARPETPLWLAPGAAMRCYVSTPLTLQIVAGGTPGPELPVQPLKHAWAGSTTDGSLCIATRTHLRLDPDRMLRRPHRILTAVVIRNATPAPVTLERLVLPLPLARLYAKDDLIWSEAIDVVQKADGGEPSMLGCPKEAPNAVEVARARLPNSRGLSGVVTAVLAGIV